MGKREPRDFYLHAMFRDSQKPWSSYIKGLLGLSYFLLDLRVLLYEISLNCRYKIITYLDLYIPDVPVYLTMRTNDGN